MDEDDRLRHLIADVCHYPDGTREWRKAMNRLLVVIQGFPEFRKYTRSDSPDYFLDALNQTWEWLSRNLQSFEPRSPSIKTDLVKWINGYLYWRIRDLTTHSAAGKSAQLSLDRAIADPDMTETTWLDRISEQGRLLGTPANPKVLSGLEVYVEQLQAESDQQVISHLAEYIEQDPDGKLRDCYPRKHPECNCQTLCQRLLFIFKNPPDKLTDIARDCQINYQTLVSHWKLKGLPLLQQIATDFGYQPTEL